MTRNKKNRAVDTGEDEGTPEHRAEDRPVEAPASHPKQGSVLVVGGESVSFETERYLKASPNSGVPAAKYAIVSQILKPGNRKVFRAVVGDELYPVRGYGKPDEVIAKIREESKERKPRRSSVAKAPAGADEDVVTLSDEAEAVLREYLSFRSGEGREEVVSGLVVNHLQPKVEKFRAAHNAISQLPIELLTALANASEETRQKILASLR